MDVMADQLMTKFGQFISASPSSFHAAAKMAEILLEAGFKQEFEEQKFDGTPGGHFFVRDGACMAWRIPAETADGFKIVGSHTDSPSFKIKPNPEHRSAGWNQLAVEVYGGPLITSWLNRDLGLAGRLTSKDGSVRLVETGPLLVLPQLAPHLDRTNAVDLDRQAHTMPVYAAGRPDFDLLGYVCDLAGMHRDDLGFYDLHVTALEKPAFVGLDNEFFAAWRMDNLSSVFASLEALLGSDGGAGIPVLAAFDHEEVGSSTRTGASGPILEDTLRRIAISLGRSPEEYLQMIHNSTCISADAAHAVHPNYVGKHDPDNHPQFNQGAVIKINSNQRYATDAVGAALWYGLAEKANVPTQEFVGNNAVPCGSTIGPLTATRLGITTVDVGIPLLSMHSARELCGSKDMGYLTQILLAYWN